MATENRESFFNRLEPFFVPSVLLNVQLAYTLAKFGHRSQVRKELTVDGEPMRYFEHVRRVALALIDDVKIVTPELIISALLHDGIEDTRDLTPEMIEHCFGSDIAKIVKTLSKAPQEGYIDRFYMSTDWRPYVIKACDRLDNLKSLAQASTEFQTKQIVETRNKYYDLFDRMVALTPADFKKQAQALRDEIRKTNERHAVTLNV